MSTRKVWSIYPICRIGISMQWQVLWMRMRMRVLVDRKDEVGTIWSNWWSLRCQFSGQWYYYCWFTSTVIKTLISKHWLTYFLFSVYCLLHSSSVVFVDSEYPPLFSRPTKSTTPPTTPTTTAATTIKPAAVPISSKSNRDILIDQITARLQVICSIFTDSFHLTRNTNASSSSSTNSNLSNTSTEGAARSLRVATLRSRPRVQASNRPGKVQGTGS